MQPRPALQQLCEEVSTAFMRVYDKWPKVRPPLTLHRRITRWFQIPGNSSDEDNISLSRRDPGPYTIPNLSSGLLPSVFVGDEHVLVDGVHEALLPATSQLLQQQQQQLQKQREQQQQQQQQRQRPREEWPQYAQATTSSTGWDDHWQGLSPAMIQRDGSPGGCQPDCGIHTEAFHDARVLLAKIIDFPGQYVQQWQPGRTDEVLLWLNQQASFEPSSPSGSLSGSASLPFQPTRQDAELLRICEELVLFQARREGTCSKLTLGFCQDVSFISRFKASLDGEPDANASPYMRQFVPFCLHSPLLIQTAMYTSACFLNETTGGRLVDSTTAVAHKCRAIRMLNEHLQTRGSTTDEAIAGVMQLMLNEWYWGNVDDLRAHLSGLREMVRLRGGFASLGLGGLLARLVIV